MIAWRRLLGLWDTEQTAIDKLPDMTEVIEQAKCDWLYAQEYYKVATDPDLIDYAVYLIKATERKYVYLLRKARQEGIVFPGSISSAAIGESSTIRRTQ